MNYLVIGLVLAYYAGILILAMRTFYRFIRAMRSDVWLRFSARF